MEELHSSVTFSIAVPIKYIVKASFPKKNLKSYQPFHNAIDSKSREGIQLLIDKIIILKTPTSKTFYTKFKIFFYLYRILSTKFFIDQLKYCQSKLILRVVN